MVMVTEESGSQVSFYVKVMVGRGN